MRSSRASGRTFFTMSRFRSHLDAIKVFGVTNYLAETELNELEAGLAVNLGRNVASRPDRDDTYYPQFEESVRREAADMAKHYEIFYCLEKSIRKLVSGTLESDKGTTWWNSGRIPQNV